MAYVLKRHEDGAYVARQGSAASYTRLLQNARPFRTREEALADACGNESAVLVDSEMPRID